jgi:tyrosine-protein phosphatase YwqE
MIERLPCGYVDIHAHVIFGMDDGPATLEESVALLER